MGVGGGEGDWLFEDKIETLYADIAKIEGKAYNPELPLTQSKPAYTGAKRGRKPNITTSLIYPYNGTVLSKLLYVIKEAGRFVTIREISGSVKNYEPNINEELIIDRFGKHIDKYRKQDKLASYRVGTKRNTVYGLLSWLKNGEVIPGREHNPEALIDKVEINLIEPWLLTTMHGNGSGSGLLRPND